MCTAGQNINYTTAPYSQPLYAQAPSAPAPAAQQLPQQQSLRHSQSASPQQRLSPNVANHQAQRSPPNQQTPPTQFPMAAPPLPQTPAIQQQAASNGTSQSPKSPQSPGSQSRDAQRVTLLLEINMELIAEVSRLQSQGKGGACSPQQQAQLKSQGQPDNMASDEYIQTLRRVQANLGYLMPKAQNDPSKAPPGPAHMTPPAHMPQLQSLYDQLKELFPSWPGYDHRLSQSSNSPRQNGVTSIGTQQQTAAAAAAQA